MHPSDFEQYVASIVVTHRSRTLCLPRLQSPSSGRSPCVTHFQRSWRSAWRVVRACRLANLQRPRWAKLPRIGRLPFNSCDTIKATALYDSEAVLWGTVAPVIITSSAGIRQYFERACSSSPKPRFVFGEQHIRVYGETAINSGTYTFTVFPGGQPFQLPARYSFTYRRKDGQWLIVDHHSSALPSPPQPSGSRQ